MSRIRELFEKFLIKHFIICTNFLHENNMTKDSLIKYKEFKTIIESRKNEFEP